MVVPFKTNLRFPIPGQQRHGDQIIHTYMPDFMNLLTSGVKKGEGGLIDQIKSMAAKVQQGMAGIISLDFDHPSSYYTRKKVTYELVTHEYNKLEVGE